MNMIMSFSKIHSFYKLRKSPEVTKKVKKVSCTELGYLKHDMSFKSWGPEVINGRCAMFGVTSGLGFEYLTGTSVLDFQYGTQSVVISSLIITIASLIAGDPTKYNNVKPFTPQIEMLNGRVAMLGILLYILYNV